MHERCVSRGLADLLSSASFLEDGMVSRFRTTVALAFYFRTTIRSICAITSNHTVGQHLANLFSLA